MKLKTKLVAVGAIGAAAIGVARAMRRRATTSDVDSLFDSSDLDQPVVVTEEVVIVAEDGDDVEIELIPAASTP